MTTSQRLLTFALCLALTAPAYSAGSGKNAAASAKPAAKEASSESGKEASKESGKKSKKSSKKVLKKMSLKEWVEVALREGKSKKIRDRNAEYFGLPKKDIVTKAVIFSKKETPDGKEHALDVRYRETENGVEPLDMLWLISKITKDDDGRRLEGSGFRVSLDGELLNAMEIYGKVGKLKQKRHSNESSRVQKAFLAEKRFWTEETVGMRWPTR